MSLLRRRSHTTAESSTTDTGRWPELDGCRGLLAVAIVVFHCYQDSRVDGGRYAYEGTPLHALLGNLEAAVAAFFALSGFLVFLPFARAALHGTPAPSVGGFLKRRLARIAIPYWIAVYVVWASRYGGGVDQVVDLIEHLTFTQVFDARHIFWDIGPTWFLAVSMIFYVVIAVVGSLCCWMCRRISTTAGRFALMLSVVATMAGVSIAYKWWAGHVASIPTTDYPVYFGPLAKMDTFAWGMLPALLVALMGRRRPVHWLLRSALMTAGVAVIVQTFRDRWTDDITTLYFHTLCGAAFAVILTALVLSPPTGIVKRLLAAGPLHWLGLISFSLFLWHEPLLIEVTTGYPILAFDRASTFAPSLILFVTLAILVAALAYEVLELPLQKLQQLLDEAGSWRPRVPQSPDELRMLSWREFEMLLVGACQQRGWSIEENRVIGEGVLRVNDGEERRAIRCELWWRAHVDVADLEGMVRDRHRDETTAVSVISSGEISAAAEHRARMSGVELIDGDALIDWLGTTATVN